MHRFTDLPPRPSFRRVALVAAKRSALGAALVCGGHAAVAAPDSGSPALNTVFGASPATDTGSATHPALYRDAQRDPQRDPYSDALANTSANLTAAGPAITPGAVSTSSTDPVMRLLEDRGLLGTPGERSLLNHVRDKASDLVMTAMNFIGVRYRRGGTSAADGFDCSGFTRHIFENSVGLLLPRRADEQAKAPGLLRIDRNDLKPGDLVFFNTLRRTFSHVGIYVGDGKFIHSPRTGGEVRVEDMRQAYWLKRFNGARRAPQVGVEVARTAP